jgi:predicted nucleotidyltransferase
MIAEKDRMVISRVAREYGVEKVLLFGSAADPERDAEDDVRAVKAGGSGGPFV